MRSCRTRAAGMSLAASAAATSTSACRASASLNSAWASDTQRYSHEFDQRVISTLAIPVIGWVLRLQHRGDPTKTVQTKRNLPKVVVRKCENRVTHSSSRPRCACAHRS